MADKTEKATNGYEQGQKIERAHVLSDGTVTIPCCEAKLVSVDVADVDLLLGFADGSYIVIPNGALDALSDPKHPVLFLDKDDTAFDEAHFSSDHKTSLGELFKMVGATNLAKAGSLRVVSEHVDADKPENEVQSVNVEAPAKIIEVIKVSTGGKGPGNPLIVSTQLIPTEDADPVAPEILQRPSVFTPGQKVVSTLPTLRIDPNITADDTINIAESNPLNMVAITGSAGGSAVVGDSVTVTVGGESFVTLVAEGMIFSVDVPGNLFASAQGVHQSDLSISASIVNQDGSYTATELYNVDTKGPQLTITLDPVIAGDGVINIEESQGTVTITGKVTELTGESDIDISGDEITLTINGTLFSGFVNPDGQTFSINVPGNLLAPLQGVEGGSGTIDARIDSVDIAGNPAFAEDLSLTFGVDTAPPAAEITLDPGIAGDGTVSFVESLANVAITGTVGLDVQDGDSVTLVINNQTYTGTTVGGAFSINVAGGDLAADADSSIDASVETFDAAGNSTVASTTETYLVDTTLPLPEIYLDAITGDDVINTVEAGDSAVAITGRVAGDAQVGDRITISVNGTDVAEGFVSSDMTFSINVSGSNLAAVGDGNTGSIDATISTSGTGGTVSQTITSNYSVDLTATTPTITVNDITPVDGTTPNTVNIAEAAADVSVTGSTTGAQAGDNVTLTINNTDYSGLVRLDGSFSITVLGSDLVGDFNTGDSSIAASVITYDAAGNPGTGSVIKSYTVDIERPTATVDIDDAALNIGDSALVTITFDEAVTGFTNADLTIENGTLTPVSSADGGITWTATLTPASPIEDTTNVITLNDAGVEDLAGNAGVGTTDSNNYAIDTISPTVTDVQVSDLLLTDADAGGSFIVTVTFSEVMDTTVAPTLTFGPDLAGSLTPSGGFWDANGTIFTASYDVADSGIDISGVTVDVSGALDANGNPQLDYAEQAEFSIDTLNPTVVIVDDNVDGTVSPTDNVVTYTLTFSEKIASFTDLDLTIIGGTLNSDLVLAVDGLSASFSVTAFDKSDVALEVTVNDTVVDLNGNPLVPAISILPVDTLNPRVIITEDNIDGVVSDGDIVVNYTLTFNTQVVSVTNSDLTITGGLLTGGPVLSADRLSATFSVTAFDNSTADLSVTVNDSIIDLAGRSLVPATITLPVDTINATVTITHDNDGSVVSDDDSVVNYTMTFAKEVSAVTDSDLTITGGTLSGSPVLSADGRSATFQVTADDDSIADLSVTVNGSVVDLNGNLVVAENSTLSVDTVNPYVDTLSVNQIVVSDSDVGMYKLRVLVRFSEPVDASVLPTLTFSPDLSSSISVPKYFSWNGDNTQIYIYFHILDAGIDLDNVTIDVTGVQDIHGNLLQDYTAQPEFGIDTQNPTVSIEHNNLDGVVSDEDSQVDYTLNFSEEVLSLSASDLQISGGLLTADPVLAADGLSATFSVIAENESTTPLNVTVRNTVTDVNGNQLDSVGATSSLPVDTIDKFPDCVAKLFTSHEFKVTGGAGAPTGSYVQGATYNEQAMASSPAGQSARDRIDGTDFDDSILYNSAFSAGSGQWMKTLHLDFTAYDNLSMIELIAGPEIVDIDGFSLVGGGGSWDGANTWTLNPDAATSDALLLNGLNLDVVYDVADTGGPVDFSVALNVSGTDAGVVYDINKTLDFSWREATEVEDFDITSASGNQVMVLPRDGFGVDIYAGGGNDNVVAGAGNDLLVGGAGGDILDGGTGNDTASFEGSVDGVIASLATGLGTAGDATGDTYFNIENLSGSDNDDILIGDGNDNILTGGDGDDILIGGAALTGDTLIGGLGNDTVSYADSLEAVYASLLSGNGSGGDASGDTYFGIENLIGSAGADTLIGDDNDNVLTGGGGGDTLQGGAGIDTASYAGAGSGVVAALDSSLWMFQSGEALGDSFDQIENLRGSDYDDILFGDSNDNLLDGGLGNDILNAGAGDDTIYADQGNDTARGDIGNDIIHVSSNAADLPDSVDGGAGIDTLVLENLVDVVGSYDFSALAGLDSRLENLEILDIREGSDPARADASTTIEITGQDILNMVDTGTLLTVLADSGDVLDLSAFALAGENVTSVAIAGGTEYTINNGTSDIATIHWLTV